MLSTRKNAKSSPAKVSARKGGLEGWNVRIEAGEPRAPREFSKELWQKSFQGLRSRFSSLLEKHGPIRARLVQWTTADSEYFRALPNRDTGDRLMCRAMTLHDFRLLCDKDGSVLYTDVPILDLRGKPFADSSGRFIACQMPTSRSVELFGPIGANRDVSQVLEESGALLRPAPPHVRPWISHDTIGATDTDLWLWSLFEFAWSGMFPAVKADRWTWVLKSKYEGSETPITSVAYDRNSLLALASMPDKSWEIPDAWLRRLPTHFRSDLSDILSASNYVIDFVLDAADKVSKVETPQLVTLGQIAAIVSRKKRSMEKYLTAMPAPKVRGVGGKPSEWDWAELRPWLENKFNRKLPVDFPASSIRPA